MRDRPNSSPGIVAVITLLALVVLGCAGAVVQQRPTYRFFVRPASDDPWTPKIAGWQARERADRPALEIEGASPVATEGADDPRPIRDVAAGERDLRSKYSDFRARQKRMAAREFASWIQAQAQVHYVPDGAVDHWATLEETLERDGDDCDGLELLTFHGLRDLGFSEEEVFRAIVYRPEDGQHHMVTLWFEDPSDPWVLDPTGAMTLGMPRLSELPQWVPLKVFNDQIEFTVHADTPRASARSRVAINR